MQEFTTDATVVDAGELGEPFVVAFSRRELEAYRDSVDPAQLWIELEREGNGGPKRLTIDLTPSDLEQLLQHPNGDDLLIALDGYALNGLFDDGEVEAHGLRSMLAIAVVAAGIAAPAGLAATPQALSPSDSVQTVGAAATVQNLSPAESVQNLSPAATVQVLKPGATAQVSKPAAKAQVSTAASKAQVSKPAATAQVSKPAAKPQVSKVAAKAQISKTLILKAHGISLFRQANR